MTSPTTKAASSDSGCRRHCACRNTLTVLVALVSAVVYYVSQHPLWPVTRDVSNGYGAKVACSAVFIGGRSIASVRAAELLFPPIIFLTSVHVERGTSGTSATDDIGDNDADENVGSCVVASSRLSSHQRRACYRGRRLGCVLMLPTHDGDVNSDGDDHTQPPVYAFSQSALVDADHSPSARSEDAQRRAIPYPYGAGGDDAAAVAAARRGVDLDAIDALVRAHFADTRLHARAFVLLRDGQVIYEHYDTERGFDADSRLAGWSMTKSVTNALLGVRFQEMNRRLKESDGNDSDGGEGGGGGSNSYYNTRTPFDLPEWRSASTSSSSQSYAHLTIGQMLRMSDGLDIDEVYAPQHPGSGSSDDSSAPQKASVVDMLFKRRSVLEVMPSPRFRHAPTESSSRSKHRDCFAYSSLTTNLLVHFYRSTFGIGSIGNDFPDVDADHYAEHFNAYLTHPTRALFRALGMSSAALETDYDGTFVGSSFGWASARDWARFGLLYLRDGVWRTPSSSSSSSSSSPTLTDTRMLPAGWVRFTATPAPSSDGVYGAQWWLGGRRSKLADFAEANTSANGTPATSTKTETVSDPIEAAEQRRHIRRCNRLYPERASFAAHTASASADGGASADTVAHDDDDAAASHDSVGNDKHQWLRESFPHGTLFANGFEGQTVAVVPSKNVVLVRLGATKEVVVSWPRAPFFSGVLAAVPDADVDASDGWTQESDGEFYAA